MSYEDNECADCGQVIGKRDDAFECPGCHKLFCKTCRSRWKHSAKYGEDVCNACQAAEVGDME